MVPGLLRRLQAVSDHWRILIQSWHQLRPHSVPRRRLGFPPWVGSSVTSTSPTTPAESTLRQGCSTKLSAAPPVETATQLGAFSSIPIESALGAAAKSTTKMRSISPWSFSSRSTDRLSRFTRRRKGQPLLNRNHARRFDTLAERGPLSDRAQINAAQMRDSAAKKQERGSRGRPGGGQVRGPAVAAIAGPWAKPAAAEFARRERGDTLLHTCKARAKTKC
eukprot:5939930-Pyramimonas_sp.AAC.1